MSVSAIVTIPEAVVVQMLVTAVLRRVARDFYVCDDIRDGRTCVENMLNSPRGNKDLLKYLREMLDGDTHDIDGSFTLHVP